MTSFVHTFYYSSIANLLYNLVCPFSAKCGGFEYLPNSTYIIEMDAKSVLFCYVRYPIT